MSTGDANQLGVWLGEGSITLIRIFSKTPGMNFSHFHGAVDGPGRTFTVLEVDPDDAGGLPTRILGGYNPQSWDCHNHYHLTPNDSDRKAFLFNLSSGLKLDRKKNSDPTGGIYGEYQTQNEATYGPTFGGHDLHVNTSLNAGHMLPYSYGTNVPQHTGTNVYGTEGTMTFFTVQRKEVFSIAPGPATPAVPEPGALGLFLPALGVVALMKRRPVSSFSAR